MGAAAAKGNDKPHPPHGGSGHEGAGKGRPAHLTWTPARLTQAVSAGQTVHVTATFTSSADIAEATLVIPGQLGRVMKADTAKLTNIKTGTVTTITFTITMPAKAHTQGGVVLVRAGGRVVALPLKIWLTVGTSNHTVDDDTAGTSNHTADDDTAAPRGYVQNRPW
jgi:hypothetical protein